MSKVKLVSAYIITHYKSWTDNLRSREFGITMTATATSTALVCEWAKVPDTKRMYVIGFVTFLAGFCYMLNPKNVAWVTDVPDMLKTVQSLALLAHQPTKADYDALVDHLPEPTAATRTTVSQQTTVTQEVEPVASAVPVTDPTYQNSSDVTDPLYHNSADAAPA